MTTLRAIVTGHSQGLGSGIVEALLAERFDVLGLSRSAQPAAPGLRQVPIDLADPDALAGWLDSGTLAAFVSGASRVLLVNNAGTVAPIAPAGMQGAAAIAQAVSLNISAPLMLANGFIAATDPASDRRILHISSGAGRKPYPGWSVYCATKAALDMHARAVAEDAPVGLRIESLAPGVIDTGMQARIRATPAERFRLREDFEAMKRDGALAGAGERGAAILRHLLSAGFGQDPVSDIRKVSAA